MFFKTPALYCTYVHCAIVLAVAICIYYVQFNYKDFVYYFNLFFLFLCGYTVFSIRGGPKVEKRGG